VARWLVSHAGSFGGTVVQLLLTVLIAGILYAGGETAAAGVRRFFRRLAGERGENAVELAGKAIRAVALGVVVTAVAQSALTGIGLAVAGVPHAGLLAAVALVLCIAQVGPLLVLAPSVIWLYATGSTTWGTVLLVWSIGVVVLDNVMRPILIKKGADLPLLLILAGVIGGLVAFGVIGIFIGPTVLAVSYTLLDAWIKEGEG
jgi:predicted PurR-regulated permease PerM